MDNLEHLKCYRLEVRLLAEYMHTNYQEIAKGFGWAVQKGTEVRFEDLPQENLTTMLSLAERILKLVRQSSGV